MDKPKIAFYWCASCGGCEEATVDLAEKILDVVNLVDIVFWPVAMDYKVEDVEKLPDGSITASFINGGVRLSEHEEMVKLLRRKSKLVIAYGACSSWGGIPGLANLYSREEILRYVYHEAPTVENPQKIQPQLRIKAEEGITLELPEFLPRLLPLDLVVDVDYYVPGCPPTPEVTWKAIETLLSGNLPAKGSVLGALDKSLCYDCPLNETKPEKVLIKEIKRPHEVIADPTKCLLTQGLVCLGPVTRGGCGALCIKAAMPCTGCFGPLDEVIDYGGKAISYFASIVDYSDEQEIEKTLGKILDPMGIFYRYSLPASRLRGKITIAER
ncbi:MAG: oxidoreductase [Thaumarchaeota archaeon]|jgi:F420-non-reducing hydrogenase small subunit|nr:oxidoreductase [Candidatus Geocrenenecus arthurdayi]MCL7389379.1 oxidoreductase [Candidatus Geocrenenecus arthurdayi]